MRVIIVGYGEMASSLLLGCIESGHDVVGILRHDRITMNPIKRFFKDVFNPEEFFVLARKYGIFEIKAKSVNSDKFFKTALKLQPDIILVGSWSEKLQKRVFNMPRMACINAHPSLLPKYRGPNPYVETIRHGEKKTGVSFHLVIEKLDRGAILMQQPVDISYHDTGGSLRAKCVYTARKMIAELFAGLSEGTTVLLSQNEASATYFPQVTLEDAIINWNEEAEIIYNQIRAFNPWQHCFFVHKNKFLKVNSAKVVDIDDDFSPGVVIEQKWGNILVSTGQNKKGILLEKPKVFGFWGFFFGKNYILNKIKAGDILGKF